LAAATNVGRRVTLATVGILLALAAVAWYYTVRQAEAMSGMVTGLAQIGSGMPGGVAPLVFLRMWLAMMVAMMFPTIGPMVLAHRVVVRHRGEGWRPTAAFVLGYLFVWTAIGLVPLGAFLAFQNLPATVGLSVWLRVVAGAILLVAALYQCEERAGSDTGHPFRRLQLSTIMAALRLRGSKGLAATKERPTGRSSGLRNHGTTIHTS
jgi:predicted metal-binding membrane protein